MKQPNRREPGTDAVAREPITAFNQLQGRALWIAIAGIMLGLLLSSLDQTIVGTAMPRIIAELGGLNHYAWVTTSYLLASTAAVPIFGKLSDIYGRKWFYVGGMILFMAGSALCGLSQTMLQLIVFRGMQGVAGGILATNAFAIIGDLFPPAERGKWQGVTGAVFGLSSVVGPTLGGYLTDGPGWRWVFYINLPVGVLAVVVLIIGLPAIRPGRFFPIDWWGAAAIVGATVPLLLAFSWAGTTYAWSSPQVIGLFVLAAAMAGLFLVAETRATDPVLPLHLFKNRIFAISNATMFLVGAGMFGSILYVPLFVQGVIGTSATNSGLVLTPMMLSLVVASVVSGQVISRSGRYKWAAIGGSAIMAVGMFLLSQMTVTTTNGTAVRNMIVLGLGLGMTMPTFTLAVQNAFPAAQLGVVTAATQFFRQIGATIGVAVMGTILATTLTSEVAKTIPPNVSQVVPPALLRQFSPQALADPTEKAKLAAEIGKLPNGAALFDQLILALRQALSTAIHDVFLIATVVGAAAILITIFLPEIELRKRQKETPAEEAGIELAIESPTSLQIGQHEEPRLSVGEPGDHADQRSG